VPQLNPGDEITAQYLNRHDAAADIVLGQALGKPGQPLRLDYDTNRITVKNISGSDRRRGEIVQFAGSPLDLSLGELWLAGGPVTNLANGFGVLLNPLSSGKFGNRDCQVAGSCLALVNVTDANHQMATPVFGSHVLQSTDAGPVRILHKPLGTGEKTCAVLLGQASRPRRAWYGASSWSAADNRVTFGTFLFREDGLTTLQDTNRQIRFLKGGDYMMTVNFHLQVSWGISTPPGVKKLGLGVGTNGGTPGVVWSVDDWLITVDSGGSPAHTHVASARPATPTIGIGMEGTHVWLPLRMPVTHLVNDTKEVYIVPHVSTDVSVISFLGSFAFIEFEPLF
jgi:hypothetical protein